MSKSDVLLEVIGNHSGENILGKKRLQKLVFLLIASGEHDDFTDFEIYKFGPFSRSLSRLVEELAYFGTVNEEIVEYDRFKNSMSSYKVKCDFKANEKLKQVADKIKSLEVYDTGTLEIASTFAFFVSRRGFGLSKAVNETKKLKPRKTTLDAIEKSKRILEILAIA